MPKKKKKLKATPPKHIAVSEPDFINGTEPPRFLYFHPETDRLCAISFGQRLGFDILAKLHGSKITVPKIFVLSKHKPEKFRVVMLPAKRPKYAPYNGYFLRNARRPRW